MENTPAAAPGPLAGLVVADFSRVLAGPYCTMLLADLGADVIKVESPTGDDTRTWVPPARAGVSTYYLAINRNKRSVALDFNDQADNAAGRELARRADIVVENFKPGGLRRFGLDYETVSAGNPAVIYASISGFGSGAGAGGHRGVRRHRRPAHGPGHPGRAESPRRHRRGPAHRDQPAVLGHVRHGQQDERLCGRWRGPVPDGQLASQPLSLRAAAHRRRRPRRGRGQRRPVPQAV